MDCAKECVKGNNDIGLFERICLDGCMLFCEFKPEMSLDKAKTGSGANATDGCTKGQLCP